MQRQKQKRVEGGFSFIELMVSMVIASFVFAGIYGVYTIQQRSYTVQDQVSEMQQKGRAALDYMVRDIRMAGYDEPNGNCASKDWSDWKFLSDEFAFDKCEGIEPVIIEYYLDEVNHKLKRKYTDEDGNESEETIAEDIEAIEFLYRIEDDTVDPPDFPSVASVSDQADFVNVRSVQISLLIRSTHPDRKHRDDIVYSPGSGDTTWSNTLVNNPPTAGGCDNENDPCRYHRRLLITSVKMRNMGI